MTFSLRGRLQTRLVLIVFVALPWTLLLSPFLPRPQATGLLATYRMTLAALLIASVLALGWEIVYHGLQQLRWDRDWPSLFALAAGVNEGGATWMALHILGVVPGSYSPANPIFATFTILFSTMWLLMWLAPQGPLRVIALRWRFRGGRFS